jgi:cytosine/adenosine deaminase-related metal-dependent hydrolase
MTAIYSASWVLPIISPAIKDGAVAVDNSKIIAVGPHHEIALRFPGAPVASFGLAAILPGLVNAHSHLELTVMRGFLEREEPDFFAWLRKLTTSRMAMTAEDLLVSALCGAGEALRAGVTCVGDSSSAAAQSMKALRQTGLRGVVYQESFGPDPRAATENVGRLREQIGEMRAHENELVQAGVSPHAAYTVSGRQLELISRLAVDEGLPVMMHVAESQAEKLFMSKGVGAFAAGLRKRGIEWKAPGISTVQYLARHGVLETKPLLAHCVTVDDTDIELIKQRSAGIAHCPKSNAKLGHGRAPLARFVAQGISVGLGSDSMASNNTCDMLEEARFAALLARLPAAGDVSVGNSEPNFAPVSAEEALFAATLGGARALGLDKQIGALAAGMEADLIVVRLDEPHQQPVRDPSDALIFSSSGRDVLLTMVAGKEIYREGSVNTFDEAELRTRMETIRTRIEVLTLAVATKPIA